jgi:hypothetical protein
VKNRGLRSRIENLPNPGEQRFGPYQIGRIPRDLIGNEDYLHFGTILPDPSRQKAAFRGVIRQHDLNGPGVDAGNFDRLRSIVSGQN